MRIYLKTFGCRANQYDSEVVRSIALRSGAELVASAADADVAVFNSCAVTSDAEADLRQSVRRAARENPLIRSYVMGCASALELDGRDSPPGVSRIANLPGVTEILSGADVEGIAAALGFSASEASSDAAQSGCRGLLRIQDGCDEHCTFCATTVARGANRSRPVSQIVAEAERLAQHHAEIVLTGVHIGSYGADIGCSLGKLVEQLVLRVEKVRFRLSSVEATEVDVLLAEMLTSDPRRVAPYLHAPLQSGSDAVLKRMGRHWYSARTYASAVENIVSRVSIFGLGADIIAGFPGESEDDHRATLQLIESLPFTSLHVFPYSERRGTAATRLARRVDSTTIARRASELRDVGRRKANAYSQKRSGATADVVVTSERAGRRLNRTGLTEDYLSVQVLGPYDRGTRFNASLSLVDGTLSASPLHPE